IHGVAAPVEHLQPRLGCRGIEAGDDAAPVRAGRQGGEGEEQEEGGEQTRHRGPCHRGMSARTQPELPTGVSGRPRPSFCSCRRDGSPYFAIRTSLALMTTVTSSPAFSPSFRAEVLVMVETSSVPPPTSTATSAIRP